MRGTDRTIQFLAHADKVAVAAFVTEIVIFVAIHKVNTFVSFVLGLARFIDSFIEGVAFE